MRPDYPPGRTREACKNLSVLPQRGPLGPFGVSGDVSGDLS
jgi:hypothetical protein